MSRPDTPTARQREALRLIAQAVIRQRLAGLTMGELGEAMGIRENNARQHVTLLCKKGLMMRIERKRRGSFLTDAGWRELGIDLERLGL
jgi:predicted ArsR family transcriptional regulator